MRFRLALLAALLLGAAPAAAKPSYPQVLREEYGPGLARSLQDCTTCHVAPGERPVFNAALPRPHNVFGARLAELEKSLREAGKPADLVTRLALVRREDADRDGATNDLELLTGHFPGRRTDRPGPGEAKRYGALRAALERARGWVWRPFEPVKRPAPPTGANRKWIRNPVDAFVAEEHTRRGLQPRPEAPREVLLRRAYLDLIGTPPTPAERAAFLADLAPGAYERVVDRLLASPMYGERWGRHWMDVWRYSDWDGYAAEVRNSQPHIWRWRDWIVRSLNEDRGYDRMVQEMLAGDELAPGDPEVLPATGYVVRNWYKFSRHETLTRIVEHTSKAFLGVTMNCARCHDHKFDAISMKEYFDFRAVFEPFDIRLDRVPGQRDVSVAGVARVFDGDPGAETFYLIQGDDRKPDKTRPARPAVPSLLGGTLQVAALRLPVEVAWPDRRPFVIQEMLRASEEAVTAARRQAEEQERGAGPTGTPAGIRLQAAEKRHAALVADLAVEELESQGRSGTPEWTRAAQEASRLQREAGVLDAQAAVHAAVEAVQKATQARAAAERAESGSARDAALRKAVVEVEKAIQKRNTEQEKLVAAEKLAAQPPTTEYARRSTRPKSFESTGRRLALARWITDRQNPLAARVAVNHLWVRHFGQGLVPTVFDFGRNGRAPSHPALLDWLASEFMAPTPASGAPAGRPWSMKRIHRLLVTSSTYRMDSTPDPGAVRRDPENRWLWRFAPRRLEAEAIRDSVLAAAELLDPTQGGPDLDPAQGQRVYRRSLYFRTSMEKYVPFLAAFDLANVNECYQRSESIVPQQALALANSPLALTASRTLAATLTRTSGSGPQSDRAFLTGAFLRLLGREPNAEELRQCAEFVQNQARRLAHPEALTAVTSGAAAPTPAAADPAQRARESLVHALLNHHEFVTLR